MKTLINQLYQRKHPNFDIRLNISSIAIFIFTFFVISSKSFFLPTTIGMLYFFYQFFSCFFQNYTQNMDLRQYFGHT